MVSDGAISKALNSDIARRCAFGKIKQIQRIEQFGEMNDNTYLMIFIVIILLYFYLTSPRS